MAAGASAQPAVRPGDEYGTPKGMPRMATSASPLDRASGRTEGSPRKVARLVDSTIEHSIILPAPKRTAAAAELCSSSQSPNTWWRRVDAVVSGARAVYLALVW